MLHTPARCCCIVSLSLPSAVITDQGELGAQCRAVAASSCSQGFMPFGAALGCSQQPSTGVTVSIAAFACSCAWFGSASCIAPPCIAYTSYPAPLCPPCIATLNCPTLNSLRPPCIVYAPPYIVYTQPCPNLHCLCPTLHYLYPILHCRHPTLPHLASPIPHPALPIPHPALPIPHSAPPCIPYAPSIPYAPPCPTLYSLCPTLPQPASPSPHPAPACIAYSSTLPHLAPTLHSLCPTLPLPAVPIHHLAPLTPWIAYTTSRLDGRLAACRL